MTHVHITTPVPNAEFTARKLDAVAWGLFFIWVGVALLGDVGWGIGLLGVGIITLGAQLLRRAYGLAYEGFWMVVGALFTLGGVWELMSVRVNLIPVLFIVAGLALIASVFGRLRA